MNKYILKPEFIDCTIITKTSDGTEIVVTSQSFNDYFGELMFKNGQHHLLKVNPMWSESQNTEKKTFVQVTEEHILLTSKVELTEENKQSETVKELVSKQNNGRGRPRKA